MLKASNLKPSRLELEVTETAMMGDIAAAKTTLDELRSIGMLIVMDDFGTGYSSLSSFAPYQNQIRQEFHPGPWQNPRVACHSPRGHRPLQQSRCRHHGGRC